MKIRLIGHRNHLGIGVHYSNFADALKRMSYLGDLVEEIDCDNQDEVLAGVERSQPDDINISFVSMPIQGHYKGTHIQWVVFESTRVPPTIMSTMLTADQVWVPSEWGRNVLIDNGADAERVLVMPEGVDVHKYHPYSPQVESPVMSYLITGKYELRKSIIETIFAWIQEFGNDPDVELIVKSNHFANQVEKYNEISNWLGTTGVTNVRVLWGPIPDADIVDLYQQSHVFVLPSKGEGWGLPLIEAAAVGLPIITTMYSGHTEFLQHIESSVIPV
jgi:glycosyltransferase involved in cell wall biosynthesis